MNLFMILTNEHYYEYDCSDNNFVDVVNNLDAAAEVVKQRIADVKEDCLECCQQIEVFETEFVDGILEITVPVYKYEDGKFYRTIQFEDDNGDVKIIYVDDSPYSLVEEYNGKLYKTIDNINIYKVSIQHGVKTIEHTECYLAFSK